MKYHTTTTEFNCGQVRGPVQLTFSRSVDRVFLTEHTISRQAFTGEKDIKPGGKRSTYKVLYWQEIPSQVKVEDDAGNEISIELSSRFAEHIDALAQKRGYTNGDDYVAQWKWSDEKERDGAAPDVAKAVKSELEASVSLS